MPRRIRRLIAVVTLLMFAPTLGAAAVPLIWCVAPGHNAIESCGPSSCRDLSQLGKFQADEAGTCSRMASSHGRCVDWSITQPARFTHESAVVVLPPTGGGALVPTAIDSRASLWSRWGRSGPLEFDADRLTQLRTVVLRI